VLRQAFVDRTLEISVHAANKAVAGAASAKVTPDKSSGPDAKVRKVAAINKRKAAAAARSSPGAKPTHTTRKQPKT
jgi:hypothetical protein